MEAITCGYLSIVLIAGLAATWLLGWWWLDSRRGSYPDPVSHQGRNRSNSVELVVAEAVARKEAIRRFAKLANRNVDGGPKWRRERVLPTRENLWRNLGTSQQLLDMSSVV